MLNATDQIKERLSIVDITSSYLKIERSGINYKAKCPFHSEKTASFFISPARGSYYCFGCGAKGDIFSFVQAMEGLDFKGALKLLADRAGVTLSNYRSENTDEKEKLFSVMEAATVYYQSELSKNPSAKKYLKDRGLTDETISSFRIGFAPDDWRPLSTELAKKRFSEAILEKAGLIKKTDKGFYDRFRNRAMFPIFDSTGRVIAFSGRTFSLDSNTPKYLNSPDTPLFDKSSALYGIDRAKEFIRKKDYAIIVEGQFDLLLSHQAGIVNTVAASGTALSDSVSEGDRGVTNLEMISRFSKNILFAFDGDKAGINAAYRGSLLALGLGMDVKIAKLPEGKDPADIIKDGKDEWLSILKNTRPAVAFFTERILSTNKDDRERIKQLQKLIFPLILSIKSEISRKLYLKEVSSLFGVSLEALEKDMKEYELENLKSTAVQLPEKESVKKFSLAERLCGILMWQKEIEGKALISVPEFEERLKKILGAERFLGILDAATSNREALIMQAEEELPADDPKRFREEIENQLSELHIRELKHDLETLEREIRIQERESVDTEELLKEVQKKTKLLHEIESQKKGG